MEPRKKQRRQGSPPFTPTNQATRVEMQDVDEITAPQRVSLALWRNDVTDTHKRVESSAQDSAEEVTSRHGVLKAPSAPHIAATSFAGTIPAQASRKEPAHFRPTIEAAGRDVDETIAQSSIPVTLWRGDRTRTAENTRSFGCDNAGNVVSHEGAPTVSSISRPSNLTDTAPGRVNPKANTNFAPIMQAAGLEIEDAAKTDASPTALVSPRRDDKRRISEHADESKRDNAGEATLRHGAFRTSFASHLIAKNPPGTTPMQVDQKSNIRPPTYLSAGLEMEGVDEISSYHTSFALPRDNQTITKEHARKSRRDKLKMGNEDMDEIIASPSGASTASPTSHLEIQDVPSAVTARVKQEAKTLFPPTYPAPAVEMEDEDEVVAPHRSPLAQQHYRAKYHAEGSRQARQSYSESNFPQNAGDVMSRIEPLAAPSASSQDNITTPSRTQADRIANSSLLPIGPEMESVDWSVAPHSTPFTPRSDGSQTKKYPKKSGRDNLNTGNEDINEIITLPPGALTSPPASHPEFRKAADAVTTRVSQKANTLFPPTYPAAGVEMEDVDEMAARHRTPLPQRHDHATGLRGHAKGSGYGIRTGDLRQSDSQKDAGDVSSRLGAPTPPSVSVHDTATGMPVDPIADSSRLPKYQAPKAELKNVDESISPHRIPFTPRSDGSQTKKNPQKSGYDKLKMRNEDMDEIVTSPPTSPLASHLETENVADAVTARVNQDAKIVFSPAAGVAMEDVDEIVAQHRTPHPQRHDRGTGMKEHAEGFGYDTRTGDLRPSDPIPTFPQNAGDAKSGLEALTAPSTSTRDNVATGTQVDPITNSSLVPVYQAAGPKMEDVDESVAPHRIPLTLQSDGPGPKKNSDKSGRNKADIGDKKHHRPLRATPAPRPKNLTAVAPMQNDQIESLSLPPTYQSTGQDVDDTFASLRESIDLGRGMGKFKGPERGMHTASQLQELNEVPQQEALGVSPSSSPNNALSTSPYETTQLAAESQDGRSRDPRLSETDAHVSESGSGGLGSSRLPETPQANICETTELEAADLREAVAPHRDSLAKSTDNPEPDVRKTNESPLKDFDENPKFPSLPSPNYLVATPRLAEADEEIMLYRKVLEISPASHSDRISSIMDLAAALEVRFGQTGHLKDLDESITLYRRAFRPDGLDL